MLGELFDSRDAERLRQLREFPSASRFARSYSARKWANSATAAAYSKCALAAATQSGVVGAGLGPGHGAAAISCDRWPMADRAADGVGHPGGAGPDDADPIVKLMLSSGPVSTKSSPLEGVGPSAMQLYSVRAA